MCIRYSNLVLILLIGTIGLFQAAVLNSREIINENQIEYQKSNVKPTPAEQKALELVEECGLNDLVLEPKVFLDFEASRKFLRKAKCTVACILKKIDLITDKNELNKTVIDSLDLDDTSRKHVMFNCSDDEFYAKCSHVQDEDECDYAYKLALCFQTVCEEKKIKFND